jgi:hypothetical protein
MASFNTSNNGLSENKQSETDPHKSSPNSSSQQASTNAATNLCVVCSTRQRAVAFVPCGHYAVCVPCGHSLQSCPTCGSNIKGLLRIFG